MAACRQCSAFLLTIKRLQCNSLIIDSYHLIPKLVSAHYGMDPVRNKGISQGVSIDSLKYF
jgi:hypothetical protein